MGKKLKQGQGSPLASMQKNIKSPVNNSLELTHVISIVSGIILVLIQPQILFLLQWPPVF